MSEFAGPSSRRHESATNSYYAQFLVVYAVIQDEEGDTERNDEEKQELLDVMTGGDFIRQDRILVQDVGEMPATIAESDAGVAEGEDNTEAERRIIKLAAESKIQLLFRLFCCWLFQSVGYGSSNNYMSAYRNILVRDVFDGDESFFARHAQWYKRLRAHLKNAHVLKCQETGEPLVKPPDSFNRTQLVQMCSTLLRNEVPLSEAEQLALSEGGEQPSSRRGADKSIENAALLLLDFSLLGRISEVGALRWDKLTFDERFKVYLFIIFI
jgi:hypothetical protein